MKEKLKALPKNSEKKECAEKRAYREKQRRDGKMLAEDENGGFQGKNNLTIVTSKNSNRFGLLKA